MPGHVFVSHSHRDKDYVRRLVEHLRAAGLLVWDDDDIVAGERWDRRVRERIASCAALVLVMTHEADESEWVAEEIDHARRLGKPILALLLAGDVFFGLSRTHYEDVTGGSMPGSRFLERLLAVTDTPQPAATTPPRSAHVDAFAGRSRLLPFYLVYETSAALAGAPLRAVAESLATMVVAVGSNPVVADSTGVCVIGFAHRADVLLPLSDLSTMPTIPPLTAAGNALYAPVFTLLRDTISSDVRALQSTLGLRVHRPVVIFVTGSRPEDSGRWPHAYQRLVDPRWPHRPNIVSFGFGDADPVDVRSIGTVRGFMSDDRRLDSTGPVQAFQEYIGSLVSSVVQSGAQIGEHSARLVMPEAVPGFNSATNLSFDEL
ncbi:TIR domain-containing protein [Virgisporangium aurantiacum]|uniref:TIR domain-containing protein n=1 Tax=Virgisporangium aurantiacum TaxID=175570 RepID=A0A8J4E7E7_9ACTN|nr:TIR domain-containing protein [Virgisporangium aurantiacum]GIJ64224.1 hypothetical protein Vau01_117400 [Virgisporangium aurantiacum]